MQEILKVKEILNLDDFIDYSLNLRSNLFKMWDIVDLGDKRRLQKVDIPIKMTRFYRYKVTHQSCGL